VLCIEDPEARRIRIWCAARSEMTLALTDSRIADELVVCAGTSRLLKQVVNFDGTPNHHAEFDRVALNKPARFDAVRTGRDDVALLAFTSGTTGEPKATMHFHRDLLIIADGYAREVLNVTPDDAFVGSPPQAFTFGLGGLAIFPLRFGAAAVLLENLTPSEMIRIIFISNRVGSANGGTTGRPAAGYEAKIVDDDMNERPAGAVGKLAVRGPTGCRYLADVRQSNYVGGGWNLTGESFVRDEKGNFSFVARSANAPDVAAE